VKNEQGKEQSESRDHLKRLRDFLDLPFSTLKDDELVFVLADDCHVVASYTSTGHLSLICEVGRLDQFSANDWRWLVTTLSNGHDHAFPASLVTLNDSLALIWGCNESMGMDDWLRRAEDALTRIYDIRAKLKTGTR
jgi:hypothetical protein